jgi:hypothetical protein
VTATILTILTLLAATDGNIVEHVRRHVAVEPVVPSSAVVPGKYGHPGGFSGRELHLFSDGTYVYTQWACVMPLSIYDKGTWVVSEFRLTLMPDADVTWTPDIDREYVMLRRAAKDELLLLGTVRARRRLKAALQAKPRDREEAFPFATLPRATKYSAGTDLTLKADLLRHAWHPERFASGQ